MPGTVISEHECHRILRLAGLPVAAGELASSVDAAEAAARRIGFPLAMKGISPLVTHRAKLGLVVLDVRSGEEARSVYCRLSERAATAGIALEGVYLQRMAAPGVEALVSAFRDPTFGVMISCAFGGGMTELIDDVALARAPLDEAGSRDLLRGLRLMRAAGDIPVAPLAGFVAALSQLAASAPWRSFTLEINPVLWNAEGAVAVDGLLIVEQP
jgi:succinyl-CoA synthetase beta subunit